MPTATTQPAPAEPVATKTFSDKPTTPAPAIEGWKGSGLQHVDPAQTPAAVNAAPSVIRAEKPAEAGAALRSIETIPTPAAKDPVPGPTKAPTTASPTPAQTPTVAPLGPAVEPAPPANDVKDVPASETSRRLMRIQPPLVGHST